MHPRRKSSTVIQYLLVSNDSTLVSTILPPVSLDNEAIEFIKHCPIDFLQLVEPLNYFELYVKNAFLYGYEFNVVNIRDIEIYLPEFLKLNQIKLIFLDGKFQTHYDIYNRVTSYDSNKFTYFYFLNSTDSHPKAPNILTSPSQFIQEIFEKQDAIFEFLKIKLPHSYLSISVQFKGFNTFYPFIPTRNNYFTINRFFGNYGYSTSEEGDEILKKQAEESTQALRYKNSFDRQNKFIEQLKKIDYFFNLSYREGIINSGHMTRFVLPPLIFVLPFHNPDLKDIYGNSDFVSLLQVEQTTNYVNEVASNFNKELFFAGSELQLKRIKFLDNVSFLHSSFQSSPVIRLPAKGKSIYREFSFLGTKTFFTHRKVEVRSKLLKTILAAGKAMSKETFSSALQKAIKVRNGQIIGISDLPIEWLLVENVPLCFTHDVCRLPETSLHGLMALYSQNLVFDYSIPKNIIKKTLVILGVHEKSFSSWHPLVEELAKNTGFIVSYCYTLEDVKKAILDFKPDFLIFDCHGGYDEKTNTTYLKIGDHILTGQYIVSNNLFAPLVFLSACGTAPTYGTIHPIATAFFEAGSKVVTSTLLPIGINSGSVLYLRVLNNLAFAAPHIIHKNWLEFISHMTRTSIVHEAFKYLYKESPEKEEIFKKVSSKLLTELMIFRNRRNIFLALEKTISDLSNSKKNYLAQVIPEYLMYTTMGRADLIYFDSWREEFERKNTDSSSDSPLFNHRV